MTVTAATPEDRLPAARSRPNLARSAAAVAGLVALAVYATRVVPVGFNPTDDGFILAQSARLLQGEVPHRDFVSPRPVGSPLLHAVVAASPTPLIVTSRLLALAQFAVMSWLQVVVVETFHGWRPSTVRRAGLAAPAMVLSLHTFPLTAWHTVDGLFLITVGSAAVVGAAKRGSAAGMGAGALVIGSSAVVKQSFVPALGVGIVLLAWAGWRHRDRLDVLRVAVAGAALALAGVGYVALMVLGGALAPAVDQLTGGETPDWVLLARTADAMALTSSAVVALLAVADLLGRRVLGQRWLAGGPRRAVLVAGAGWLVLRSAGVISDGALDLRGQWSTDLWWLALAAAALASAVRYGVHVPACVVLAAGYMTTLSWGYPYPSLVAGGLAVVVAVCCADVVLQVAPAAERAGSWAAVPVVRALGIVAAAVVAVAAFRASVDHRDAVVYRDLAATSHTVDLGAVDDDLWGVRTNPVTAGAVAAVASCLERHPADALAVVPDGPVLPLVFDRVNPLPVDWWYPDELVAERAELLDAVDRAAGDARSQLVLFQTFPMHFVAYQAELAPARPDTPLFDYGGGFAADLFDRLPGEVVTCGPYLGRYVP